MLVFGITGGSGSGKTTVSDIFRRLGVYVIDADKVAREVVKKGTACLGELSEYFGSEILLESGELDRKKLASIAFSDKTKLKMLNKITHSHIKEYITRKIKETTAPLVAIDGAVIIGSEIEDMCEFMLSVLADREVRISRITKRDNISRSDAEKRLSAQPDDEFYIENSKYIVYNNSDINSLTKDTETIFNEIMRYKN